MFDRMARWRPDPGPAVAALAPVALAVIHLVDLPGTLGPDRLIADGYLGIIAAAVLQAGRPNYRHLARSAPWLS